MTGETLETRIRRLEDIEEIKQLKAKYCAACDDDHNPDRVAALFVEGGVWQNKGNNYCDGHAQIKEFMGGIRNSGRIRNCAHMVFNPAIEITGDAATAHWRFQMMHTDHVPEGALQYHRIIGYYEDQYVRCDGRWMFQELCVTVEESGPYTVEDDLRAAAE